jgi:hypothetical protein
MIDAMKQALEALKRLNDIDGMYSWVDTEQALRQAIEEAEQWDTSDMAHRPGGLSVEQEPVAWVSDADFVEGQFVEGRARRVWWECNTGVGQPLYTAPPKREWVGLTDEDIRTLIYHNGHMTSSLVIETEALLKERNNG